MNSSSPESFLLQDEWKCLPEQSKVEVCLTSGLKISHETIHHNHLIYARNHNHHLRLPLFKVLGTMCKVRVQQLRRNAKLRKHLYAKMSKISMSPKHCPRPHEKYSIHWRHNHQRTYTIAPRTILHGPLQPEHVGHGGTYEKHGGRAGDGKYCA